MNGGSTFNSVMLAILTAVVCIGVYTAHDHMDLTRERMVATEEAMRNVSREVGRLREDIRQGLVVAAPTSSGNVSGNNAQNNTATPKNRFANADLRPKDAEYGGRRVLRTLSFPGGFNSIVKNEAGLSSIWNLCFDSLGERHLLDVGRFEPVLAESWEVSDDGLIYTIRLRKNITWHPYTDPLTGEDVPEKPVTADDFVFYWNTIQNEDIPCEPIRGYFELMQGIEKIDDYTIRVTWKEPYSLAIEQTLGLQPLPRHYYRSNPNWSDKEFAEQMISSPRNHFIVGCGPYRFDAFEKGKEIRLKRYENYYGPRPYMDEIVVREIKDSEVAFNEFKKGNIDTFGLTPEQWVKQTPEPDFLTVTPSVKTAIQDSAAFAEAERKGTAPTGHKYEKYQYRSLSWAYIGYNQRKPLFKDTKVRLALTHCVDRERIRDEVLLGLGTVLTGPFVPQSPYYDKTVEPYPFDIEKAKSLFTEAGWSDTDGDGYLDKELPGDDGKMVRRRFEFDFIIPSSSVLIRKWATIAQQDMAKAGVKANIKPLEWSVYIQTLDEFTYDVCSLLWSGGLESDPYQIWHSSQAKVKRGSNHVGYISEEADRLIETGRRSLNFEKRVEIYHQFHRLLHRDQPYTFLLGFTSTVAVQEKFRNTRVFKTGLSSQLMWLPAEARKASAP